MTDLFLEARTARTPAIHVENQRIGAIREPLRLLAALDGSPSTEPVLKPLFELHARGLSLDVVLLSVQPAPQDWRLRGYGWFQREAIRDRLVNDLGRRALTSAAEDLDRAGIAHRDRVELGEPAATIVRCAEEEGCEMIVVSEPGLGAARDWLMRKWGLMARSVASTVVHLARVPVLISR